ncbi:phage tail assembly chaperone, partial [Listeria monocytogenes]
MTQNNVINIQLEESYQEFQLGTELFRVGLGDEMRHKWIEADEKYKKKLE